MGRNGRGGDGGEVGRKEGSRSERAKTKRLAARESEGHHPRGAGRDKAESRKQKRTGRVKQKKEWEEEGKVQRR